MEMFLNIGLAKLSTVLAILLSIIYVLRKSNFKFFNNKNKVLGNLNKWLRFPHKELGVVLIITGLVHGLYSSDSVLSLNWGTACWVMSVLLGLNFMFKKHFKKRKGWIYYHRVLTILFIFTLVVHIALVKGIDKNFIINNQQNTQQESKGEEDFKGRNGFKNGHGFKSNRVEEGESKDRESQNTVDIDTSSFDLSNVKDGVYSGEANGYRPNLQVQVTVKDKKITKVEVVSNNETPEWYNRVVPYLTDKIVEKNSIDVDTVSGATRTSVGIINAVKDALNQ